MRKERNSLSGTYKMPSIFSFKPESESESRSVVSHSLRPHGLYSPWNSPGKNTGVHSLSLLQGIFPTQSPALQVDSLPAEPPGKPKNTGVGSLSLLQQIFLAQESNWGLMHSRQILYRLSYQGSPKPEMHLPRIEGSVKITLKTGT